MDNQPTQPVQPPPAQPAVPVPPPPTATATPAPSAQTQAYVADGGKKGSKLPLVLAVLFATLILAGIAFYISQSQQPATSVNQTTVVPSSTPTAIPTQQPTDEEEINAIDVESGFETDMTDLQYDVDSL